MTTTLLIPPSKILRQVLIDMGLVVYPGGTSQSIPYVQQPGDGSTVCFISSMPNEPDQAVCIYDTIGPDFGRRMDDGTYMMHRGVQLRIRSLTEDDGYNLAALLTYQGLDTIRFRKATIDGVDHFVDNVYRNTSIISLGEEVGKRRQLFTVNARIVFPTTEPNQG